MCLVLFAYQPGSSYPLVVAANRDEFYARPAESAHRWPEDPDTLAGRDLSAGGTWLGVHASGRFATVTNFAEEEGPAAGADAGLRSRGELIPAFLQGDVSAHDFAHQVDGRAYRGYNLLLWDGARLVYTSNRATTRDLDPGVYGLANAELGAKWPKVRRGRAALAALAPRPTLDALIAVLGDDHVAPDGELPRRGRPIELERRVAPCFIRGDEYGTRASTAVIVGPGRVAFREQLFGPGGTVGDCREFELALTGAQATGEVAS